MTKAEQAALCNCPIFRGLEFDEITLFLDRIGAYCDKIPAGEEIPTEKDGKTRMGIILSGTVKILSPTDHAVLNRLESGSVFGVSCLYGEESAKTLLLAKKATSVLFFGGKDAELLWEDPRLRKNLISFLTDRIRFLNEKIASFTAHDSEEKLLSFLKQNTDEAGKVQLPASFAELARTLHLGRASLYRAMEKLEARGVLIRNGKFLKLCDPNEKIVL